MYVGFLFFFMFRLHTSLAVFMYMKRNKPPPTWISRVLDPPPVRISRIPSVGGGGGGVWIFSGTTQSNCHPSGPI